jgi:uncharacterized protein (TIGR00661 family)
MARILYGYSGEGSGHSSRTSEMARRLVAAGHDVRLCSYDRGYRNLRDEFDVLEIGGLTITSEDNRVSVLATIRENLRRLPSGTRALGRLRDLFRSFRPHVVVCDFEPMSAYLAEHYQVPLVTLDNQHRMRYVNCGIPREWESRAAFTRRLIRVIVPWPSVSLILSLVEGETTNERSFVYPPIIRREITCQTPTRDDHILVYLTSGFDSLLPILQSFEDETFLVYGYSREGSDGNLQFFMPDRQGFAAHLASARGVIATAGFTLISEALWLGKPVLALPMAGQYEQELNAWQLQQAGWGHAATAVTRDAVHDFLTEIPLLTDRLSSRPRDDGSAVATHLLKLVDDNGAQARQFRERRGDPVE